MASLEGLRHVTIGQYLPTGSVIHRLDPRTKLLALFIWVAAVLVPAGYLANVLLLLLIVGLVRVARLPLGALLGSIKPALPLIIALALMQLLFYGQGTSTDPALSRRLLVWGPLVISGAGVRLVIVSLLRFADLLLLTSLLTNCTTASALGHGIEHLLGPLDALHLPGHELALATAIAFRFLPILGEQLEAIGQAQAARQVKPRRTNRWQVLRNAQQLAALVVPLFVDAFRRTDEMVLAMQARCYQGGRGRTHLVQLRWRTADSLALGISLLALSFVIVLQYLPLP